MVTLESMMITLKLTFLAAGLLTATAAFANLLPPENAQSPPAQASENAQSPPAQACQVGWISSLWNRSPCGESARWAVPTILRAIP